MFHKILKFFLQWNEGCVAFRCLSHLLWSFFGQFLISIVVERPDGRAIAKPVELRVMVGDANDNRPTFPQAQYHTVVKELAARGSRHLLMIQR